MFFNPDFDSERGRLEHSCDMYRDAAAGITVIQRWIKEDGRPIVIEMPIEHPLPENAIRDAEYQGVMTPEEAAQKVGELSLKLEQYGLAS